MKADLIIIGNELLNGKIKDLNTSYLAKELFKLGHELRKVHLIQDHEASFEESLNVALDQSDLVLISGGLGPTKDDITKAMLSKFFNKEIVFNQKAHEITLSHYERGKREYNKDKIDYHNLPLEFTPIYNPIGYAPAIHYRDNNSYIFALPGVPSELKAIFEEEILKKFLPSSDIIHKHLIIKTWKLPEAKIFHSIDQSLWDELEKFGSVSSLPHKLGVDIGIHLQGINTAEIQEKEKNALNIINSSPIKDYIWNIGPESLEEVIVLKAKEKNLTIGFAESCTGGLCASRITDISGSSSIFWGSVVSYANEVKIKSLNVSEETLKSHGAVSKETAYEMAIGAREHLAVDIAVTTTGIAGPGGATPGKPVGTVGIGFSTANNSNSELLNFRGNRVDLKYIFSQAALFKLLEIILDHPKK